MRLPLKEKGDVPVSRTSVTTSPDRNSCRRDTANTVKRDLYWLMQSHETEQLAVLSEIMAQVPAGECPDIPPPPLFEAVLARVAEKWPDAAQAGFVVYMTRQTTSENPPETTPGGEEEKVRP